MSKKPSRFSDQVRAAIDGAGMNRRRLSQLTGVPESSLSRFMAGTTGLTTESLDRLAEALGWTLHTKPKRKGE